MSEAGEPPPVGLNTTGPIPRPAIRRRQQSRLGTAGACRMFFRWFGTRHGGDDDEIGTDRFGGGLTLGRRHGCDGARWPSHRGIPTGHEKPEPLRLLRLLPAIRAVLLSNTLLCSRLPRPTLRVHGLARLALV